MYEACIGLPCIPYYRFPEITTTRLGDFVEQKAKAVLQKMFEEGTLQTIPNIEVRCFPLVIGDKRQGIKYATMVIGMTGIDEAGEGIYAEVRRHNYRPTIIKGIHNSIVRGYEFSDEKLKRLLESPKELRGLALTPKDVDHLYQNRKLQISSFQGKPYYKFYADMDRILDDALMDATIPEDQDAPIPNYVTLGIKSLGDKPDSPLSYDIVLTTDPRGTSIDTSELFKTLVSR